MVLCQSSTMIGFLFFFLLVSFSKDPSSSSSSSPFTTRSSFCPSFALLPLLPWPSGVAAAFSKAGSAAFSKAVFCFFSYSYTGWKMKQLDFCLFCSLFQSCSLLHQAFLCIWPCNDQVGPLLVSRLGVAVWVGGPTATRLVFAIQAIVAISSWRAPILPVLPIFPLTSHGSQCLFQTTCLSGLFQTLLKACFNPRLFQTYVKSVEILLKPKCNVVVCWPSCACVYLWNCVWKCCELCGAAVVICTMWACSLLNKNSCRNTTCIWSQQMPLFQRACKPGFINLNKGL